MLVSNCIYDVEYTIYEVLKSVPLYLSRESHQSTRICNRLAKGCKKTEHRINELISEQKFEIHDQTKKEKKRKEKEMKKRKGKKNKNK